MPVFTVTLVHRNGNRCSRPIPASCACHAIDFMKATHEVADNDPDVTIEVEQANDPDGQYERLLIDANRRADEAEYWDQWDRR